MQQQQLRCRSAEQLWKRNNLRQFRALNPTPAVASDASRTGARPIGVLGDLLNNMEGIQASKVTISKTNYGVGLVATEPVFSGDVIAVIPRQYLLGSTVEESNPWPGELAESAWAGLKVEYRLALKVVDAMGPEGMKRYPAFQIKEQRASWEAIHESVQPFLEARGASSSTADSCCPSVSCLDAGGPPTPQSKERFFWSIAIVLSRSFNSPVPTSPLVDKAKLGASLLVVAAAQVALHLDLFGLPLQATVLAAVVAPLAWTLYDLSLYMDINKEMRALFPVIDFVNHDGTLQNGASFDFIGGQMVLKSLRDVAPGDEVLNTYGPLPNTELLTEYGFVEADNYNDEVPLSDVSTRLCEGGPLVDEMGYEEAVSAVCMLSEELRLGLHQICSVPARNPARTVVSSIVVFNNVVSSTVVFNTMVPSTFVFNTVVSSTVVSSTNTPNLAEINPCRNPADPVVSDPRPSYDASVSSRDALSPEASKAIDKLIMTAQVNGSGAANGALHLKKRIFVHLGQGQLSSYPSSIQQDEDELNALALASERGSSSTQAQSRAASGGADSSVESSASSAVVSVDSEVLTWCWGFQLNLEYLVDWCQRVQPR
eukprot:gene20503-27294_t